MFVHANRGSERAGVLKIPCTFLPLKAQATLMKYASFKIYNKSQESSPAYLTAAATDRVTLRTETGRSRSSSNARRLPCAGHNINATALDVTLIRKAWLGN